MRNVAGLEFAGAAGINAQKANEQTGCASCALGCVVASSAKAFPKNVSQRIDALVVLMGEFSKTCSARNASVQDNCNLVNVDNAVLSSFRAVVAAYRSLVADEGQAHPTLEHTLNVLVGTHANDVFAELVKLSKKQ